MACREVYRGRVTEELSSVLTPSVMGQYLSLDCLHSKNKCECYAFGSFCMSVRTRNSKTIAPIDLICLAKEVLYLWFGPRQRWSGSGLFIYGFFVFSRQLLLFLKGFTEDERFKLGTVIGICLANGLGEPTCLPPLFEEHLVKEGKK